MTRWKNLTVTVALTTMTTVAAIGAWMALSPTVQAARGLDSDSTIEHVLLISIDGMHQVDLDRYLVAHPHSAFAQLVNHGVEYTRASTAEPSDSFPGLLA